MTQGLSTDDLAGRPTSGRSGRQEPDRQDRDVQDQDPQDLDRQDSVGSDRLDTRGTDRQDQGGAADPPATEMPLLDDTEADGFLSRWSDVQSRFVDDPQAAVRDGDNLVAELMRELAQRFSERKADLEEHWTEGGEPETEELRLALQQYRSFFQRLLAT